MSCIRTYLYVYYAQTNIIYRCIFLCNVGLHECRPRYPTISPPIHSCIVPFIHLSNISLRLCMLLKDPPIHLPISFFLPWCNNPSVLRHPHYRGFITLRHTTLGKTPLDEWSARRRGLYLTTHNTHETEIHVLGGIRTHNPSKPVAPDPHLRPRGHWDRPFMSLIPPI